MSTFTGHATTNDRFIGTTEADLFLFAAGNLNSLDVVAGGTGADVLRLTTGGVLFANALEGVTNVERFALSSKGNGVTLTNANFPGVTGAKILVTGNNGNDIVDASGLTGANRVDVTAGAGADILKGGAGADVFRFAAANLSGDTVIGGAGIDLLRLTTSGAVAADGLAHMAGVEKILFASGGNATTLIDANFTGVTGAKIAITGGGCNDAVDASGVTGLRAIDVTAGAGADTFKGGAGADVFRFAAANLSGDTIIGGAGSDQLRLTTAGAVAADGLAHLAGVERIVFALGGNAITLANANFSGVIGAKITVTGAWGDDTVDASGLTGANRIDVTAGAGADSFTGGAGADVFRFVTANLSGDTIIGGAGIDRLWLTTAGAVAVGGLAHLAGVDQILFSSGGNAIKLQNSNVFGIAHSQMVIMGGAGDDIVDASGLTDANRIDVTAGAGLDSFTGGANSDVFRFAAADLSGDHIDGRGSGDYLVLTTAGTVVAGGLSHLSAVENILLASGGNAITLEDANLTGVEDGILRITGSAGNDTIDGSALKGKHKIEVVADAGVDTFIGGDGADVFRFTSANLAGDTIAGGGGYDSLTFLTSGVLATDALAHVTGIDKITLVNGSNALTLTDANYAVPLSETRQQIQIYGTSGATIIDASALTGKHGIDFFDYGGISTIIGGAGDDLIKGFSPGDTFDGGAGSDTILFGRAMDFLGDTIRNVEYLKCYGGSVTISGEIAASLRGVGSIDSYSSAAIFTVLLSAGTSTDLSNLAVNYPMYGNEIHVVSTSGNTGVMLSPWISSFTGSDGSDAVGFGAGSRYLDGAIIDGGGGDDRIVYDPASSSHLDGGTGNDTLVLVAADGFVADLRKDDQVDDGLNVINTAINFENVDASAVRGTVLLAGRNDVVSVLIGGSGDDTIVAGEAGATITGGLGADTLTGSGGNDLFQWSIREEGGDTINGFTSGQDKLVFATSDFRFDNASFDTVTIDDGHSPLLNLTDLFIISHQFDSAAQVRAYIDDFAPSNHSPMFIIAENSQGHSVLYYSQDAAKAGVPPQADNAFYQIADLGFVDPNSFQLSDFGFV